MLNTEKNKKEIMLNLGKQPEWKTKYFKSFYMKYPKKQVYKHKKHSVAT